MAPGWKVEVDMGGASFVDNRRRSCRIRGPMISTFKVTRLGRGGW